jgi:23S rRNA (uridine2552-2'-O)-methyltransferase
MRVLDLGAAPGGWTQVTAKIIGAKKSKLVALDILPILPIEGAEILQMDFLADDAPEKIKALMGGPADLVLSDMSPNTTGHPGTDHIRIVALAEMAAHFAVDILAPGGAFVCKFFQGGAEKETLTLLKQHFAKTRHAKPLASRAESSETYLVAQGFKSL